MSAWIWSISRLGYSVFSTSVHKRNCVGAINVTFGSIISHSDDYENRRISCWLLFYFKSSELWKKKLLTDWISKSHVIILKDMKKSLDYEFGLHITAGLKFLRHIHSPYKCFVLCFQRYNSMMADCCPIISIIERTHKGDEQALRLSVWLFSTYNPSMALCGHHVRHRAVRKGGRAGEKTGGGMGALFW